MITDPTSHIVDLNQSVLVNENPYLYVDMRIDTFYT